MSTASRSESVNVDDRVRERLWSFLRQVVPYAAFDVLVGIRANEFIA
jgi:hypothetical protein